MSSSPSKAKDSQWARLTTKPKPEKPADKEIAARIADRQAPKAPKEARHKCRVHWTGRKRQFNLKATNETGDAFTNWRMKGTCPCAGLLEQALDALERAA